MSFGGDLHTFDVLDLVGWLMGRKPAGVLQMTRRSTKKRMAFRDGQLQWSSSNDPRETIGQVLVRDGLISEEALFRALLKQEAAKDKRRLGEILIAEDLLSEPQLLQTLRGNAEAQLYDCFLWGDGRFDFDDAKPPAPEPSDLGIDMKLILEEGRYRREEWHKLRTRFTSNEVTFRLTADPVQVIDPQQRQVLDLAAWGKTLAAISLESRRSEFETTLLIGQLVDKGFLAIDHFEIVTFARSEHDRPQEIRAVPFIDGSPDVVKQVQYLFRFPAVFSLIKRNNEPVPFQGFRNPDMLKADFAARCSHTGPLQMSPKPGWGVRVGTTTPRRAAMLINPARAKSPR
jgi:hypothetical protein